MAFTCPEDGAPGTDIHSKVLAPQAGCICSGFLDCPPQAHLKTLMAASCTQGFPSKARTHGTEELLLSLWNSICRLQFNRAVSIRVSPPVLLRLTQWQGLHFSWCRLLAMKNTTVTNHVHEACDLPTKLSVQAHPRAHIQSPPFQKQH